MASTNLPPVDGEVLGIKQAILLQIRHLQSLREPLNITSVKRNHPHLIRQAFGLRPFLGWIQALRDAGIDYAKINTELDEFIECRICGRFFRRLPNHLKLHDLTAQNYCAEFNAESQSELERAKNQKRGRLNSISKGQLPLWDAPFCEESTLDRIAEYHRQGVSVHYDEIVHREPSLINHAIRYCGSWDEALQRIGLDSTSVRRHIVAGPVRYPTPQSVLQAIRQRYENRLPLNHVAITAPRGSPCQRDIALFNRAILLFGSWDNAIRSSGLPRQRLASAPRYTTQEAVLTEIHRRHCEEMPLTASALTAGPKNRDKALYRNGQRLFGSWNRAIAQAGLPLQAKRVTGGRYPTAQAVIQEIQRRAMTGLPISSYLVQKRAPRDAALYKCARDHFGDWTKALNAANISSI